MIRLLACACVAFASCAGLPPFPSIPAHSATRASRTPVSDTVDHPPPPGTAVARGSVQSCDDTAPPRRCRIRIRVVEAYGMNTPPIAPGPRTVRLHPSVLAEHPVDSLLTTDLWRITLVHAEPQMGSPQGGASSMCAWTLTKVDRTDEDEREKGVSSSASEDRLPLECGDRNGHAGRD